jgi:transposase, IS30 family
MGKNRESAIGTLVERTMRFLIIVPLKKKDATAVRNAFQNAFKKIPKHLKLSMTYDNETEMAQHKLFTKNTKVKVYFAHPYSPWEKDQLTKIQTALLEIIFLKELTLI